MTDNNLTPPPELVEQWKNAWFTTNTPADLKNFVATQAARWGADAELEACCEWVERETWHGRAWSAELRAARRPKPSSLKELALAVLNRAEDPGWHVSDFSIVRKALEQLDD